MRSEEERGGGEEDDDSPPSFNQPPAAKEERPGHSLVVFFSFIPSFDISSFIVVSGFFLLLFSLPCKLKVTLIYENEKQESKGMCAIKETTCKSAHTHAQKKREDPFTLPHQDFCNLCLLLLLRWRHVRAGYAERGRTKKGREIVRGMYVVQ